MAITRRQFIKRTGAAAAGTIFGPSLFNNPFLQKALADTIGDRYFVVVYLDGGNDGLNTVTPYNDGSGSLRSDYNLARTSLNLSPTDLDNTKIGTDPNTSAQLALHPGLIGLKNLYDMGKVAIIQGCGYPEYSLSHDSSRTIWQTANPLGLAVSGGWIGRYLAANYTGSDVPGVNLANHIVGEFQTTSTGVLTIDQLENFGFPYDYFDGGDDNAKRTAFLALCNAATSNAQSVVHYLGDSGAATLISSESYPGLHGLYETDRGSWSDMYSAVGRSTARDLREVAKVIYGVSQGVPNVHARFFQVSNGGYDTHSDQGAAQTDGQHYSLHREIGDSLEVFYNDCADMGVANKLCIVVWSEFSRRIQQNDSGTDHGSQAPMFVIGGTVKGGPSPGGGAHGGVYGNHPNINDAALNPDDGNTVYKQGANTFRSTDFRDVYGTLLKHWLGMTDPSGLLPTDTVPGGGDPDDYWTAANFDLAFLP